MPEPLPLRAPTGRIAFARIHSLTLEGATAPAKALREALVAGTRVDYYGRAWRMGKWRDAGNTIVGRIGFESSATTELWDEELNDFRELARPSGLTSPFAIDPQEMRVAFQLRGKAIKAQAFTNALQALLDKASPTDRWRVERETRAVSLEDWASEVDRVTALRLYLERPNPHYGGRKRVRALVEGTNASNVEIAARADKNDPQGLDLSDPLVQEAIEHAENNYGYLTVVAEHDGETSQWSSETDSVAEIRFAPTDPESQEVSTDALRRELGDPLALAEEVDEARAAAEAYKASEAGDDEESEDLDMFDRDDDLL